MSVPINVPLWRVQVALSRKPWPVERRRIAECVTIHGPIIDVTRRDHPVRGRFADVQFADGKWKPFRAGPTGGTVAADPAPPLVRSRPTCDVVILALHTPHRRPRQSHRTRPGHYRRGKTSATASSDSGDDGPHAQHRRGDLRHISVALATVLAEIGDAR